MSAANALLVFAVNQVAGAVPFTPGGAGVQQALLVKVFSSSASTTVVAAYSVGQQLATLDTTLRRLELASTEPIVVSDTVGFIKDLPHDLVAAFRGTLKEAIDADLLLHVIDASHPDRERQIAAVDAVLVEIGADEVPRIMVLNKCDLAQHAPGVERDEYGKIASVRLSALTGAGVPEMRAALAERFPRPVIRAATA